MRGHKRKHGAQTLPFGMSALNLIGITVLGLGFVTLMLLSMGFLWQWIEEGWYAPYPQYAPYRAAPTHALLAVTPSSTPVPNLAAILPEGAQLVVSTAGGDIFANQANGQAFKPTGFHGQDVAVSPDGITMAYIRGGTLYIQRNGQESRVPVSGTAAMPTWNADGSELTFVLRDANADHAYRLLLDTMQTIPLLTVPHIVAPLRFNPATGRILIVERTNSNGTSFYSIAADCADEAACRTSRRDIANIKQTVDWADYHPNAASIVFSDETNGNLYLLMTASGDVQPLLIGTSYKKRPTFNRDGTWLAYNDLGDVSRLYVLRLSDHAVRNTNFGNVASFSWAG